MTENPPAPAAAIAVTTTKTRKHVSEGYDIWYKVCRTYEENDDNDPAKAKYKNKYEVRRGMLIRQYIAAAAVLPLTSTGINNIGTGSV